MKCVHYTTSDTEPSSRNNNSQEPGIGRVASFGKGQWIINNLGKDTSIYQVDNHRLRKLAQFDESIYCLPGNAPTIDLDHELDEAAQFDLDIHSILMPGQDLLCKEFAYIAGTLWLINHDGLLRIFPKMRELDKNTVERMRPLAQLQGPGDIERYVLLWPHLICSSPLGYHSNTDLSPGLWISETLTKAFNHIEFDSLENSYKNSRLETGERCPTSVLGYNSYFEEIGIITALSYYSALDILIVCAGNKVMLLRPDRASPRNKLEFVQLQTIDLPFDAVQILHENEIVILAGYRDNYKIADSSSLWCKLFLGKNQYSLGPIHELDIELAWGNGSEPLVLSCGKLAAMSKKGDLSIFSLEEGRCLGSIEFAAASDKSGQLPGIAHLASEGPMIVAGFNRDGYRAHIYQFEDC